MTSTNVLFILEDYFYDYSIASSNSLGSPVNGSQNAALPVSISIFSIILNLPTF